MARFSKDIKEKRQELYLEGLAKGMSIQGASDYAGIHVSTAWRWGKSDKRFKDQCVEAQVQAGEGLFANLYEAACGYRDEDGKLHPVNVPAADMWLRNYFPGYKQRLMPTDDNDTADMAKLIAEQMKELEKPDTPDPSTMEDDDEETD